MTRDEIIRMAREAKLWPSDDWYKEYGIPTPNEQWLPELERFATLVAAAEREEIMDEWWGCVQSDLENGVKSLNERAAEKWHKEYPAIAGFAAAIRARGQE